MPSIAEWDVVAHGIADFYTAADGLGRSSEQMSLGEMANWLWHWREGGHDIDWIRDRIRESAEWQARHGGVGGRDGPNPPPPDPPPPVGALQRVIRITNESDGELINRGYSYYSQAWVSGGTATVFVGHRDGHPRFFSVDLNSGSVNRLGMILQYTGEAEGWYFDREGWVYLPDGPRLRRVNPFTAQDQIVFDISDPYPQCDLWQAHSSDDGRVHSATVRRIMAEGRYPYIATVVSRNGQLDFFPALGDLDESIVTSDGAFVAIQESNDLRVINLETRETRTVRDSEGALAHIDAGPSFLVGEADRPDPQACVKMDLRKPLTLGNRVELFRTNNMGHVSVKGGRCLLSNTTSISLVGLNGQGVTPLLDHGMTVTDSNRAYDFQVFGNLDPSGRVFVFLSNKDGRLDAYLGVL